MKSIILIIFLTTLHTFIGQDVFHQNVFKGGVTGAGFSTGLGAGAGDANLYIEPGSVVKKVYLFTYSSGQNTTGNIIVNGIPYLMDETNKISEFTHKNFNFSPLNIHCKDITSSFTALSGLFNITFEVPLHPGVPYRGVHAPYIYIEYENTSLPNVSSSIIINQQNQIGNENYSVTNLNAINFTSPVGFAIYSDRTGGLQKKNSNVFINSIYIGTIGGSDQSNSIWNYGGVKGHFYYQNNLLYGLDDDTPDAVVDSTDGLADISSYIMSQSFNFTLTHVDFPLNPPYMTNANLAYFLTNSTPCDIFSTTVEDKIQTCKGDSVQMQVTGGTDWKWEPQEGLSCYNCAQPYFTDTVSRWYTVRIYNNDSCSKVLPVRVEVLEKPASPIVVLKPTKCRDSSGVATIQIVESSYQYSINNGALQGGNVFNNLFAGNHTVSVTDTVGCKSSTVITILKTYPSAFFTATPQQGDVPLDVYLYNTSVGANNFTWYIDQDTLQSVNVYHTFNTEGNFNATLVVYDTYPQCADTMSLNILAEYPFTIFAPSLQENKKGNYQIYTSGVKSLSYHLYNTLGQIIYTKELENLQGYQDLWSAYTVAKGTYLYKIIAIGEKGEEKVVSGKVVVI